MENWLLTSPILICLCAAIIGLLLPKTRKAQGILSVISSLFLALACATIFMQTRDGTILSLALGNWTAPFGIVMVADLFSAVMLCITALIAFTTILYACADIDNGRIRYGFFPFLHFLLCGIYGAFLTGDLFNLYVWFEIMLISSFALLSLGGEKRQLFGTIKYVALNLISTLLLLTAIGIIYGLTGSINMADIAVKIPDVENSNLVTATAILFIIAFGIKAAVFPLFFWLPASYHMPPVTVSAIFAGLLTKVGIYALYRVMTLIFTHDVEWTHTILIYIAGLTMITGVLGAAVQNSIRRILSFHIISQIGYMVMGLALATKLALIGGIFYIVHHIIVKANLFFIGGVIRNMTGNNDVRFMGGLYAAAPWLAILFMIPALSLAGIPPLSGFWAKFTIIKAGLDSAEWLLVFAALFTGLFTVYSMMKIWAEAFWKKHPENKKAGLYIGHGLFGDKKQRHAKTAGSQPTLLEWGLLLSPCIILASTTLWIGLYPQPFFEIAAIIAEQLTQPQIYIDAVLNAQR